MDRWRQLLTMVLAAVVTLVLAPAAATAAGETLEISGPTSVAGGDAFTVTFTVTDGAQPVQGAMLDVERYRYADHETWDHLDSTTLLTTDEAGHATIEMTAGAVDSYRFETWGTTHTVAVSRQPTTLTPDALPERVLPGAAVPVSAALMHDGAPLTGRTVTFAVRTPSRTYEVSGATNADGRATVVLDDDEVGSYTVRVSWAGTTTLDDAVASASLYRGPDPSTLTVSGPEQGEAHVPVTITGSLSPAYGGEVIRVQRGWNSNDVIEVATDDDGSWSAEVDPYAGYNWWTASFAGNDLVQPASATYTLEIPPLETAFEDVSLADPRAGDSYRLTGRLTPQEGQVPVSLTWDGGEPREFYTAGDGSFDIVDTAPATAGQHTLRLEFEGDDRGLPASAEYDVLVGKGHPGFHVSVEPNPDPGKAFLAEGQLDYQSTQSTHVVVTDPAGERSRVPVRIEDSHQFNIPLRAPDTPGTNATWKIRFPGDADHLAQAVELTALVRSPFEVRIREPEGPATVGGDLWLGVRMSGADPDYRVVARRPDGSTAWEREGTHYSLDELTIREPIDSALEIAVTVAEDDYHHRTRKTYLVRPFRALTTRLGGQHTDDGGVAVYASSAEPRITSVATPAPGCVTQHVQVRAAGRWRTVTDDCVRVGRRDVAATTFDRDADRRTSYRVRSEVRASEWYRATTSPWEHFRFRG